MNNNTTTVLVTSTFGVDWEMVPGCAVCERAAESGDLPFIQHYNCLYINRFHTGHDCGRRGHCTADACY